MRPRLLFSAIFFAAPALFAQTPEDIADEPPPDHGAEPTPTANPTPTAKPTLNPTAIAGRPALVRLPLKDGMLRLPGGRFTMGSADRNAAPNERPPHAVTVGAFWMDRTEVTVGAYRACVDKHACAPPEKTSASCTYDQGEALLPISCVHWKDADGYCRFLGKRLPRETEWEFAARGTARTRFPWGNGASCANAVTLQHEATGRSCGGKRPANVGAHPSGASIFGVLDLAGNVEEWTSDWYAESLAEGAAPRSGSSHVLRGGGWQSPPSSSRTTSRNWGSSVEAGPNVGFRCAKDG